MSMLGLGDIVISGIFVALMLRYDVVKGLSDTPYFITNLIAYELASATVAVMHFFDAAQPACVPRARVHSASLLTAAMRKELPSLLNFSVEKAMKEEEKKAD